MKPILEIMIRLIGMSPFSMTKIMRIQLMRKSEIKAGDCPNSFLYFHLTESSLLYPITQCLVLVLYLAKMSRKEKDWSHSPGGYRRWRERASFHDPTLLNCGYKNHGLVLKSLETKTTCCMEQRNGRKVMGRRMEDRESCGQEQRPLSALVCHYLFVGRYQGIFVAQLSHQSKDGPDQMPSESLLMMK